MSQLEKILIVEDNNVLRIMYNDLLENRYEITTAKNCKEAIELVFNDYFDLIITDLGLPDGHGLDIIKKSIISPFYRDTPNFMVLTGSETEGDVIDAIRLGAKDYLIKSGRTSLIELEKAVKNALAPEKWVVDRNSIKRQDQKIRNTMHDLANCMTPIIGYGQLLKERDLDVVTEIIEKLREAQNYSGGILVVEDSLTARETIKEMLDSHKLIFANSLEQAKREIDKSKIRYSAILLDLGLPDGDGSELLNYPTHQKIRPLYFILTGQEERAIEFVGKAEEYLKKGDIEELAIRVKLALLRRTNDILKELTKKVKETKYILEREKENKPYSAIYSGLARAVTLLSPTSKEPISMQDLMKQVSYITDSYEIECPKISGNFKLNAGIEEVIQIVGNIVDNAYQHGKRIKIGMHEDNEFLYFAVRNDGTLPKENIFDFGVKGEKSQGQGRGLSIVKGKIKEINGLLEYESKEGQTEFIIGLPKAA